MGFGFLTMAYGPSKYIRQAEVLAKSLRLHMPDYPVAVVTDGQVDPRLFDHVIPMKPYDKPGVVLKIDMYDYTPFDETLFIDSDCIATRPFDSSLEIRRFDFTPVKSRWLSRSDSDPWINDVAHALDLVGADRMPSFNGGVYFFRKGPVAASVFEQARELHGRAAELGLRNIDKAGPNDESIFGLVLARLGLELYDDQGALMSAPIRLQGPLKIDPLGGETVFCKDGVVIRPAIVHFCAHLSKSLQYEVSQYAITHGRHASATAVVFFRLRRKLERMRDRFTKRKAAR